MSSVLEYGDGGQSLLGGRTTKPFCGDLKTMLGFGICPEGSEEPLKVLDKREYAIGLSSEESIRLSERRGLE